MIGVDLGTTNSVVTALRPDGTAHTVRHRFGTAELDVIRSVLAFAVDGTTLAHAAGPAAVDLYLDDPHDTRLMMSLKSYLAQASFTETRIFGRPFTLEALIALFLRTILPGHIEGATLVAGRPVRTVVELQEVINATPAEQCALATTDPPTEATASIRD